MEVNPHKGHRERVKKEFLARGIDKDTPAHKVLELLLFYCLPQGDTNPLAHALIDRYKTLAGVLDAPIEQLVKFKGLTENNVLLLKLIMPIARIYNYEKGIKDPGFNTVEGIGDFIVSNYSGFTTEKLSLLSLDSNCRPLSFDFISEGDTASVGVSTRDVIKTAIDTGAYAIVMAHNHPGGFALPSKEDIHITSLVKKSLSAINVRLLDHIIIGGGEYVSLSQSKDYAYIFD